MRDFVHEASPLGITHFIIMSSTKAESSLFASSSKSSWTHSNVQDPGLLSGC